MIIISVAAICIGACAGAVSRWLLGLLLNPLLSAFPLGTLAVNWLGAWFMGLALALFACHPAMGQQWRLMIITGFLGSLTTFSAFSAEMSSLISNGRLALCALVIGLHVAGSILMVFLGMATYRFLS